MRKLHTFPLETTFVRKIKTGVQYFNQNHYTNFSESSLKIETFYQSRNESAADSETDSIFEKILSTIRLHNTKYLTKLDLSIQGSFLFETSTLRKFGFILAQNFKTLKRLDLRFLNCRKLNGSRNLRCLLDSLTKGMGHLTEVNLYFLVCGDVDDQCLKDIKLLILKRCRNLQRFKMIITGDYLDADDRGFLYFEPDLDQRLQNKSAIPEYGGGNVRNPITDKGGASFCRNIARYLKKLRSLTFTMDSSEQGDELKFTKSIYKMLAGLPNLENLNFNSSCDDLKVDDEYLEKLTSCIGQNLKNLKSLNLDFPYITEITKEGYQKFANSFLSSFPPELTYLALNLEYSPEINDEIIKEIGLSIAKNFKNLQTLILNFDNNELLAGKPLLDLTEAFSKGLSSLKKLVLGFGWCEGINQFSRIALPEQIEQFDLYVHHPVIFMDQSWKGLNRLSLSFDACNENESFLDLFSHPSFPWENLNQLKILYSQSRKIPDKEMRNLASLIGTRLENLTSLELGFSEYLSLTSNSALILADNICRKLKKLRNLSFSFYQTTCKTGNEFYEGAVIYLTSIIASKLENLESLTLLFHHTMNDEINQEEMFNEICSAISQLKKLKKLTLAFDLYQNTDLKRYIREKLCHIPMLYLC